MGFFLAGRDRLALLRDHALLRHLAADDFRAVLAAGWVARYPAGQVVFKKGTPQTDLMIVLTGRVKLSATSAAGHELLIHIAERGHSFGELALVDGKPRSFDATALDASEIVALTRASLMPVIARNPGLGLGLMQDLCRRARRSEAMIEDAVFLGLAPRLARQLLRLAERAAPGPRADLAISQQALASLVGVTRESVNKQLCAWRRAGIVGLRRGAITIEVPSRLRRICGDDDHPPEPGPPAFARARPANSPRA